MRLFLIGARYADKLSQFNMGLMHLNGQEIERGPLKAGVSVALSAGCS